MSDTPTTLKLRKFGNSYGIILPADLLKAMGAERKEGESIVIRKCAATGGLEISAENPEFARKLDALRDIMREDDDVFRELAK